VGDRFPSVIERDGDWWKVTTESGREGWVPSTYLRNTFVARPTPELSATMVEGDPTAASPSSDNDGHYNGSSGGGGGVLRPPRAGSSRHFSPQHAVKTPARESSVGKALRESRDRRRNRAKADSAPANPSSAFTASTAI
jgi:hypothetical protein